MSDLTPVQAVDNCISLLQDYRKTISGGGATIKVKNGDDLQLAHDSAKPGDTLLVQPGPYLGLNITKSINMVVDASIPDVRVSKDQTGLIELNPRTPSSSPLTIPGNLVNVIGVKLNPVPNLATICVLSGDSITLDKYLILGDPVKGQRRGIAANCSNLFLKKGYIDDIFANQDSQAVAMWNGSGPFTIDDNYMSASGETIMSGGTDSPTGKQPSHLTLVNNYLTKNVNWHSPISNVKNTLELKDMISAVIKNNIIENSWLDGQTGYLILFTPRNQEGTEPTAQVAHIELSNNIIRNGGAGIQLLGADNQHPSLQTIDINILNNQFDALNKYSGDRRIFTFTGVPGCRDVTVKGNKIINSKGMNSFLYLDTPLENLVFTDNDVPEGEYGVKATDGAPGISSWNLMVKGGQFANNIIHAGGFRTIDYGGNGNVVVP
jgi:hypothetical protein